MSNIEKRIADLLGQMTLAEKIGQMVQADLKAVRDPADVQKYGFGSMLSGGDSKPAENTPECWLKTCNELQSWALKTRLKIPLIYGIDAVHGHNNVPCAVIFPHHIGLGATRNAQLVREAQHITALEVAGTGMRWAFAPCVAVVQDERWGRTYESYGRSPELVSELGAAAVIGLQGPSLSNKSDSVLACAKHFLGDGGTESGHDQGNTVCDETALRNFYLPPYRAAIEAGVASIMVSFSSWNGTKMHAHKYLLTDVLKGHLGFKGFLVSDWAAIDKISPDYKADVQISVNAGLDMVMIPFGPGQPNNYVHFIEYLTESVVEGKVPLSRIDDAVARILRVKLQMGLFENPFTDLSLTAKIGCPEHRQVARQCVQQSLVLLKNNGPMLPLSKDIKRLAVVGTAANDLGIQCGGWTVTWQGGIGENMRGGTSILTAIRKSVSPGTEVIHSADGNDLKSADAVIVVLGELPYAEFMGDRADLEMSPADVALVEKAKVRGAPVVTILLSGRPLRLGSALSASDAFIIAWLPGSEGQGVADILFGDVKPTGKLPLPWPASEDSPHAKPQFEFGFGLGYGC
jgi:beta-glucosidase